MMKVGMKRIIALIAVIVLAVASVCGQSGAKVSGDPNDAKIITSDIQNFWRAYDLATPDNQVEVFEREYLKRGSDGLRDFIKLRITSADALVKTINKNPKYYASIRESTLRVEAMETKMRACFYALKYLYNDAVFPDVYFVIGRMSSGGTTSDRGLLIGTEMHGRTARAPEDELSDWHKQVLRPIEDVPYIVAHELIHYEQKHGSQLKNSLLYQSLNEGSADFIAELISGGTINPHLHVYGNPKEKQLWEEFKQEMDGVNFSKWLYNGFNIKDRPADLGYYMGYKIVESYYNRMKDKRQAIKDILEFKDPAQLLKDSGYEAKFQSVK
jgi:predicted Zn-dependent protease DUF2268